MTNDSVQKETYLKQKKKKLQHKLYTPWERGDCRKCEEISQDQSITEYENKKYSVGGGILDKSSTRRNEGS